MKMLLEKQLFITSFFSISVQSVPLTYIPDLGVSKQLPTSQAAFLISIVGIANIFGRVISGIITDVFRIQSIVTYTCTLLTASAVNFLLPWCDSFATMAVCSAIFGLCMGKLCSVAFSCMYMYCKIAKNVDKK